MKKSDDIAQAFLLKHFPGRRKLSSKVPPEVSWRNSVLVATTALILAVLTAVILVRQTRASLYQEQAARRLLEQRLDQVKADLARVRHISRAAGQQASDLARAVQDVSATAGKEEQVFLARILPEALHIQAEHGIPASALVAMAIHESAYGKSELSVTAQNVMALKAGEGAWKGPSITLITKDTWRKVQTDYRQYPDLRTALEDYVFFLKGSDLAVPALGRRDGAGFLEAMAGTGYHGGAAWQKKVAEIMEKHHLSRLDAVELVVTEEKTPEVAQGQPPWEKAE